MATPDKIKKFYYSSAWRRVRKAVKLRDRGVCQVCGKAGWEVHHKVPLTLENVDDPNIAYGLDNLELLCTSCHNEKREEEVYLRRDVEFDEHGQLVKKL